MQTFSRAGVLLLAASAMSCSPDEPRTSADSQAAHVRDVVAHGGVVDSIHPIEELLRRFRESAGEPTDTLRNASSSLEQLVDRWAKAVAQHDTLELNRMVLNRAEFVWLFYPSSPLSKPPYEAPPELLWGQILASSNDGATKVQTRFGGKPLHVLSVRCPDAATQGENRIHEKCDVEVRSGSDQPMVARLFGTVFERDGRFKFVGLSSSL